MPKTSLNKRDRLFEQTASRASGFEFNEEVAEVFDDMLLRSVPFYLEQQYIIKELARQFYVPGACLYDLGCSTATTLINLALALQDLRPKLIGYDNSLPMVEKARKRVGEHNLDGLIDVRVGDLNTDLAFEPACLVTMCWTLQFVRPIHRERVIRDIHAALIPGGALIVTEKVLTNSNSMNRLFIERYYEFKERNGYSRTEIARKREALENVLVPFRSDENIQLFRQAGFAAVETFFQWYNFVGFLCTKTP